MKRQTNIPCPGRWQCDSKLNKTGKSIQTYSNLFVLGSDSKNQTKNVAPRLRSNKVENDAWQSKPLRCFFRFARLQRCKQGRLLKVTCRVYTDAISQNIPNFTKLHLKWDQWSNTIRLIWYISAKQTCVLHSKALNTMNPMNHETWAQGLLLLFFVSHSVPCVELLTSYFDHSTLFNFMSTNMSIHWGEGASTLGMHATHERSTLTPLCNKRPLPVEFERRDGFEREAFPPSLSWVELRAEAVSWVVQKSSTKITFCENAARDKK